MATKTKEKSMKINTPYPKKVKSDEVDYLGNKLADLNERVNELELSIEAMRLDVKRVLVRMGL